MQYGTYNRVLNQIFVLIFVLMFSVGISMAQPPESEISRQDEINLQKKVTLDADDAFLPLVLSELAEQSGYNIVTGTGVDKDKKVSVHLKDTPIGEAINLVVRAAGLSYEIVGKSFLVAETDVLTEDEEVGLEPYVIQLQYAKAEEVKELLTDLTEKVQVEPSSNSLLVTTTPRVIDQINTIIDRVDVPPLQVMMEARIIELSTDDAREYGIDWEKLSHLTTILAEDFYFNEQGVPPGVEWVPNEGNIENGEFTSYEPQAFEQLPDEMPFQRMEGLDNVGHFSRQLTAFDVTLDFLLKNNIAKVVANTRLTTMNNRHANILIGEVIPYMVAIGAGDNQTWTLEKEEVGTKLFVTPTVNEEGYITLEITPEVSNVIEILSQNIPRTRVRTATTTVIARDGQQIVIGGFLQTDEIETQHKLPILGSLPFIGKLFQHKSVQARRSELMIEIRPHILVNGEPIDSADILEDYPLLKMDREVGKKQSGLKEVREKFDERRDNENEED